jgi:hypothetical protein
MSLAGSLRAVGRAPLISDSGIANYVELVSLDRSALEDVFEKVGPF